MARSRFCRICKEFHDLEEAWPEDCLGHFGAPAMGAAPYVQSDSMAPIISMADGKPYDSKSRYRADLKARGMIEVGNDRMERRPAPITPVRETLRQTYQQLVGRG
jgi:hypothetical protein